VSVSRPVSPASPARWIAKTTGSARSSRSSNARPGARRTRTPARTRLRKDRTTGPKRPPTGALPLSIPLKERKTARATRRRTKVRVQKRGRGGSETPERDRPEAGCLRSERATRLTCAEGEKTSGEVPVPAKRKPGNRPIVTDSPAVPASADWFGSAGRSRVTNVEAQARSRWCDAAVTTRERVNASSETGSRTKRQDCPKPMRAMRAAVQRVTREGPTREDVGCGGGASRQPRSPDTDRKPLKRRIS